MRILISGSSGFIGSGLCNFLKGRGHALVYLKRGDPTLSDHRIVYWDPDQGVFTKNSFEGFDVVIHLAGASIAGRWTRAKMRNILLSRTVGTWFLSFILSQALRPPKVFLSASAIGYYGNRGEEILTEESSQGSNFLASVCSEWERATHSIRDRGSRVINARFAPVLGAPVDTSGGILQKMIPIFKWGLGGRLGSGNQWMSWISLSDLLRAIDFCLHTEELEGPINMASPHPVRQREFAATLAEILHRKALIPQPTWLLRLLFGPAADELMLSSARVYPEILNSAHFSFQVPELKQAIQIACNK